MIIGGPAQVFGEGFVERGGDLRGVDGYVVLEPVFADEVEQFLELGDANHAIPTKGIERVVGDLCFAQVGKDLAVQIIGGNAAVGERLRLEPPDDGAVGAVFAHRPGDDGLVIHLGGIPERRRSHRQTGLWAGWSSGK